MNDFKIENGILYKREKLPSEKKDIGDCYYCKAPVFAHSEQVIKYKVITVGTDTTEYPTHKICRKLKK